MKNLVAARYAAGSVLLLGCLTVYALMDARQANERQAQILMASGLPPVVAYCTVK